MINKDRGHEDNKRRDKYTRRERETKLTSRLTIELATAIVPGAEFHGTAARLVSLVGYQIRKRGRRKSEKIDEKMNTSEN